MNKDSTGGRGYRPGYRRLLYFPIWRMYDKEGNIIASCRAFTLKEARAVFKYGGFTGNKVKKFRPDAR